MTRLPPSKSRCLAGIELSGILVLSMTTRATHFTRSPCSVPGAERALDCRHARLPWRDHADVALCSAAVPRPSGSSLMPLRRAPRRPDLARGVGVRAIRSDYRIRSDPFNVLEVCVQPTQTNPIRGRGGIGAWRSEIKGELPVIDRRGGHSRSYAPVPPWLAKPSSETFEQDFQFASAYRNKRSQLKFSPSGCVSDRSLDKTEHNTKCKPPPTI